MSNKYHSKIMQEYENIRNSNEAIKRHRKEEVYIKIPEIKEIDSKINALSLKLALTSIKSSDDLQNKMDIIKEEILNLRTKKYFLLTENNYPIDYFNDIYECKKCNDTGYVNGKKCICYKKKLVNHYYNESEFSSQLESYNFSNFNLDLFDDVNIVPGVNKSSKNLMKDHLESSLNYIKNFNISCDNILMYGESGTGKTFLATSIAKALLDDGHLVVYRTCDDLVSNLKEIKYKENNKELEELLLNCDLLIIDDLGTEMVTDFSRVEIFNLINKKLLLNKKMIISTNYDLDEIKNLYSERLFSRLIGEFHLMPFKGEDLRIKKAIKRNSL